MLKISPNLFPLPFVTLMNLLPADAGAGQRTERYETDDTILQPDDPAPDRLDRDRATD